MDKRPINLPHPAPTTTVAMNVVGSSRSTTATMTGEISVHVRWPGVGEEQLMIAVPEAATTVHDLKLLIERDEEDFVASDQLLLFNGRELFDDELLAVLEMRSVTCTRREQSAPSAGASGPDAAE